nr:helix-turn-helix transcriptional regulator [Clostridium paraputrificum]
MSKPYENILVPHNNIVKKTKIQENVQVLAKNIKEKRLNKGLGVKALANLVGVSNSVIFNIESGKTKNPRIDIVCKIAKVFNVTLDELVYGKKD